MQAIVLVGNSDVRISLQKITTVIFALLIIVQESVLLFGGVVNSNFLMWVNMWIPNMTIATYLAAFLTGMVWGSKK